MIVVERLNPSEWDLLKIGGEFGFIPDPDRSIAVVARNDSKVIGRTFLVSLAHLEGTEIERQWRNGPVLKQLMDGVEIEARAEGLKKIFSYAPTLVVEGYLNRLGYKREPLTVWAKDLYVQP